ncbi:MAG TPA: M3 family metallopeptidase [Xanthobacteraceae bacterium]|nr:M3 family metallopeptidase [Xanthobacteraceae bacterium]
MNEGNSSPGGDMDNPLLGEWTGPFGLPPFGALKPEHFPPAFEQGLARHRAEIDAIAADPAEPNFDNTVAAMERSGTLLTRVSNVFFVLAGADTSDDLQAIERDISPLLARHDNEIYLNEALFRRIDDLHRRRHELGLTAEQRRVLERYHTHFVRAGAGLDAEKKRRLAEIGERLASLGTAFGQNVLADEKAFALVLEEGDLGGLPDFVLAAARAAAEERGFFGKHVITLSRSSIEPFLQFSSRRDLREKAHHAWLMRGENGGANDNRAIIAEMAALRAQRAKLLGYASFADYRLADQMAKTPQAVRELLDNVWQRGRSRAQRERDELQAKIREEGGNFAVAPWDWRYYAEKVRKARYAIDEAETKPFFQLDRMIEAAFETARRLFGLTFSPVDLPLYHPDVRAWEVKDAGGRHVGLFLGDYFARESKHSGAWMTSLRDQEKLAGEIPPIIVNVMNFSKPEPGHAALLSFDDARTLFHEFGHALHGLLSNVTYPLLSGTSVSSDFVELPSQLYEHWLEVPEILKKYARHCRTGEPMPQALLDRVLAARNFNQGCATVEYTASALVDIDLHSLPDAEGIDVTGFERGALARIGMPDEIAMRHRLPHFQHLFSGGGYAAAYYSYLWSEVLDADAFLAFEEKGNAFDPETAQRLRDYIYSAGNLRDPTEAYIAFRGRLPTVDALLKKRGLEDLAPAADA